MYFESKTPAVIVFNSSSDLHVRHYNYQLEWSERDLDFIQKRSTMREVARWCDENLEGTWLVGSTRSGFEKEIDALAFKLRWI